MIFLDTEWSQIYQEEAVLLRTCQGLHCWTEKSKLATFISLFLVNLLNSLGNFQWIKSGRVIRVASILYTFRCYRICFQSDDTKLILSNSKARLHSARECNATMAECMTVVVTCCLNKLSEDIWLLTCRLGIWCCSFSLKGDSVTFDRDLCPFCSRSIFGMFPHLGI